MKEYLKSGLVKQKSNKKIKMESDDSDDYEDDWDISQMESVVNKRHLSDEEIDTVPKKRKKTGKDLYKPPTADELNQLRETENLYHSNLFRLEIEEILNEVKLAKKYKTLFNCWFSTLKECIDSIEETKEYKVTSNLKILFNFFLHYDYVKNYETILFKILYIY